MEKNTMTKQGTGWASAVGWMLSYLKNHRGWFACSATLTLVLAGLSLVRVTLVTVIIENAIAGDSINHLLKSISAFVLVVGLGSILTQCNGIAVAKYSSRSVRDMKTRLAQHVMNIRYGCLGRFQSGDLTSRLNQDIQTVGTFLKANLSKLSGQIIMGLAASLYIVWVDWRLFAVCMCEW